MSEDHWQVALRHAPPGEVPSLRFPEGTATTAPVAEHTQPPPSSVYSEPHIRSHTFESRGRGHRSGAGSHRGDRGASDVGSALALPQQQSRWVLVDDVITSQEVSQAAHRQRLSELTVRAIIPALERCTSPFPRAWDIASSAVKVRVVRQRLAAPRSVSNGARFRSSACEPRGNSRKTHLAVDT